MAYEELVNARFLQQSIQNSLGLSHLSATEIDVFIALSDIASRSSESVVHARALIDSDLLKNVSRATVFRALKKLELDNIICKIKDRGGYCILNVPKKTSMMFRLHRLNKPPCPTFT